MTVSTDHRPTPGIAPEDRPRAHGGLNGRVLALELRRVLRNRRTMIFTVIFPVAMFFFVASQIPASQQSLGPGVIANVNAVIMVNMAVYGATLAATTAGSSVSVERSLGWSRQLRLTPLRPVAYIVMKVLAGLVTGALACAVVIASGLFSGQAHAAVQSWVLCALIVVAGSLVFAAFGIFLGYLLPVDSAMQMMGGLLALMSMFGGIFFPIEEGTTFDKVASMTPMYGLGKLAAWPLTLTDGGGHGDIHLAWILNLVIWAVLFVGGAAWRFRGDTARV